MAGKRRRKFNTFKILSMVLIITCICTVLYYNYLKMEKEKIIAAQKLDNLNREYQEEVERKEAISDYKAYVQTKQFAEEVARKKFGLVYEDEIIFKVGDGDVVDSDIVEIYDAQAEAQRQEAQRLEEQQRQEAIANGTATSTE